MAQLTFADKAQAGSATGFDYLRIGLALSVMLWHSLDIADSLQPWDNPLRFLPRAIIPMFFALSGFLIAGSLERNSLHGFLTLRIIRIAPALAVEVALSAAVIGLIFTDLPLPEYLTNIHFLAYFANIIGDVHFQLPGVYTTPHSHVKMLLNFQLWTIPYEFKCYFALTVLALFRVTRNTHLFASVVLFLIIYSTVKTFNTVIDPTGMNLDGAVTHVPGHALVLCFLSSVVVYQYRNIIPYSTWLGIGSGALAAFCLEYARFNHLASIPIAYFTVWLGLMRPPGIAFGDLSYGVYLFHYPLLQTVKRVFPQITEWWLLFGICLPLVAVFAFLSWTFIEHPILRRKKPILAVVDRIFNGLRSKLLRLPSLVVPQSKAE